MILDSACSEKIILAKCTRELSFPFNRGLRRTGRSIELDVLRNGCKHTTKKRVKCTRYAAGAESSPWKQSPPSKRKRGECTFIPKCFLNQVKTGTS